MPRSRRWFDFRAIQHVAGVALLAGACSSVEPGGAVVPGLVSVEVGAPPAATFEAGVEPEADARISEEPAPRELSGRQSTTYVADTGDVSVAPDFSNAPPSALVLNAAGTSYDVFPGTGDAFGNFVVPNVPPNAAPLLKFATHYAEATTRSMVFEEPQFGRPSRSAAPAGTLLALSGSSFSAWGAYDLIGLVSSNSGFVNPNYLTAESGIANGATSFALTVDHSTSSPNWLIDAAAGDSAMLVHYGLKTNTYCRSIVDAVTLPTFSMTATQTTSVTGAFAPTSQSFTWTIAWKRAFYEAHRLAIHPSATASSQGVSLLAAPAADRFGGYANGVVLVGCQPATIGSTDETLSITYGNPLPSRFVPYMANSQYYDVPLAYPGAAPLNVPARIVQWDVAQATVAEPRISPVRNLKIDGQNAHAPMSTLSGLPRITWDPPLIGTPTRYVVDLWQLTANGGKTEATFLSRAFLKSPTFRIPPGVLAGGKQYFAMVTVQSFDGRSYEQSFVGAAPTSSEADAVTQAFSL